METCCICLDNLEKFVYPDGCNCKVKMHKQCLTEIKNYGFCCPICRKRRPYRLPSPNRHLDTFFERNFIDYPMNIFLNMNNPLGIVFMILYFTILFLCVLLPLFFYQTYPVEFKKTVIVISLIFCYQLSGI